MPVSAIPVLLAIRVAFNGKATVSTVPVGPHGLDPQTGGDDDL